MGTILLSHCVIDDRIGWVVGVTAMLDMITRLRPAIIDKRTDAIDATGKISTTTGIVAAQLPTTRHGVGHPRRRSGGPPTGAPGLA